MNGPDESEIAATPPVIAAPTPQSPPPKPLSYWAKRLLVCNPFYLVSAALLLFGMYRLSVDRNLFTEEISQLAFNLSSLQFYEILLVGTAVFLAGRKIWYDSTLLVGLENLFLFVPFILVSQVALIDMKVMRVVCLATALIAVLRVGSLKRYFRELNLPAVLLALGAILLLVNIGLLATYRIVGETRMGWKPGPEDGRVFVINQLTWLVILPAALAMANFLPHARENGSLLPQRRWLPAGFFALWGVATGVHLYCLNYVYNFAFRIEMLVPALWVIAWTTYRKAPEIFTQSSRAPQYALAIASLVIPLAAASRHGTKVFFVLTLMNAVIYRVMCFGEQNRRFVRHLLFASVVLLICGFPTDWVGLRLADGHWIRVLPSESAMVALLEHRETLIRVGLGIYLMLYAVLSRNPKVGILGSVLVAGIVAVAFAHHDATIHWAVQSGLAFLLLHSLRWEDSEHDGANIVRGMTATLWVIHTFIWVRAADVLWLPCIPGGIVLAAYVIKQLLRGRWDQFILPAASILTVLSGPGNFLVERIHNAPSGLLAMIGSFLLFALGTAAALTRHRWHHSDKTILQ